MKTKFSGSHSYKLKTYCNRCLKSPTFDYKWKCPSCVDQLYNEAIEAWNEGSSGNKPTRESVSNLLSSLTFICNLCGELKAINDPERHISSCFNRNISKTGIADLIPHPAVFDSQHVPSNVRVYPDSSPFIIRYDPHEAPFSAENYSVPALIKTHSDVDVLILQDEKAPNVSANVEKKTMSFVEFLNIFEKKKYGMRCKLLTRARLKVLPDSLGLDFMAQLGVRNVNGRYFESLIVDYNDSSVSFECDSIGAVSAIHMVQGTKFFIIYPPTAQDYLRNEKGLDAKLNTTSIYNNFLLIRKLGAYVGIIKSGETIVLPEGWGYFVKSVGDGYNVSVVEKIVTTHGFSKVLQEFKLHDHTRGVFPVSSCDMDILLHRFAYTFQEIVASKSHSQVLELLEALKHVDHKFVEILVKNWVWDSGSGLDEQDMLEMGRRVFKNIAKLKNGLVNVITGRLTKSVKVLVKKRDMMDHRMGIVDVPVVMDQIPPAAD